MSAAAAAAVAKEWLEDERRREREREREEDGMHALGHRTRNAHTHMCLRLLLLAKRKKDG